MIMSEAQQICERFGFNGECGIVRDMCKVRTISGVKYIKKVSYGIDRLIFLHEAKEHLIKNGFYNIDRFYISPEGNPYIIFNENVYIAIDCIDERECDFKKIGDVKTATEVLADFHKNITGYKPSDGIKTRDEIGLLVSTLKKRSDELLRLKKVAQKSRNRFDFLFIDNVNFFLERSSASLEIMYSPTYSRVLDEAIRKKEYCHRDYSFHNLVFDANDNLYINNFDYFCSEINVYDIASFLRKIMTEYKWNVDIALQIVNWYDTINKIDKDELAVLAALLEFPQKFWRIANRYYNSRRTRPENGFYNKLMDVISEKELYKEFITGFKKQAGI